MIFGHGNTAPENRINSKESFLILRDLGVDGVELDVRLSQDNELLVIHDAQFEDGRAVAETVSTERPKDVLLLAEVLDLCRGLIVNIEIKNYPSDAAFDEGERITDEVLALLADRSESVPTTTARDSIQSGQVAGANRVLVSCFGIGSLDRIRTRRPELETAHLVLSRRPATEVLQTCIDHGHRVIHPFVSMVDETFMKVARDADLSVNVWTHFDETDETIETLLAFEVDGVITGFPERALRYRG